jgi:hydrogenase maturation protein HypF
LREAKEIWITGLVQGVGFRPFIYKLALRYQLAGQVENNNLGVRIIAEGEAKNLKTFVKDIQKEAPLASTIESLVEKTTPTNGFTGFAIAKSRSLSSDITEVSPDIAVCEDCLHDMKTQPHRLAYPFINCTHCGPRFTITRALPYDRPMTTMAPFKMCKQCTSEYKDVMDRRFHAQPIACEKCGPHYFMWLDEQKITDFPQLLDKTAELLYNRKIVAIKGIGGFHLACNALDEKAVSRLRRKKNREAKPFAVMFRNLDEVKKYLHVNKKEESLLQSWRRPIVLLKQKLALPPSLSRGLKTLGVVLPYMPFHYLLFGKLKTPAIVLTSGNLSDEPVLISDKKARKQLTGLADAVVGYNREIYNRADDSVALVVNGKSRLIRRSRSYVPSPIRLHFNAEGIFAAGAELVNCFAMGKGKQALLSQHIGDLKNPETFGFYQESYERFKGLFRFSPGLAVADLHPDYLSTRFAEALGLPIIQVQHHHAHIASCMAEHGLDEQVIGISLDGTGLGTDGKIWGGEVLICDLVAFKRALHLEYIPQPGGDLVTHEPWRMAVSYLTKALGEKETSRLFPELFSTIETRAFEAVQLLLNKKLNSPETSSMGRLFDAVAALTGVCQRSSYHAEAPMRLESAVSKGNFGVYPFEIRKKDISVIPMIREIVKDKISGIPSGMIAAKFHHTIVKIVVDTVQRTSRTSGLKKVVLSGGSFQNRILLENTENQLLEKGFHVFAHEKVPSNDAGIALGQLAIAAKRRENQKNLQNL